MAGRRKTEKAVGVTATVEKPVVLFNRDEHHTVCVNGSSTYWVQNGHWFIPGGIHTEPPPWAEEE